MFPRDQLENLPLQRDELRDRTSLPPGREYTCWESGALDCASDSVATMVAGLGGGDARRYNNRD